MVFSLLFMGGGFVLFWNKVLNLFWVEGYIVGYFNVKWFFINDWFYINFLLIIVKVNVISKKLFFYLFYGLMLM